MKILTNLSIAIILTFVFVTYVSSCAKADAQRLEVIQCMNGDRSAYDKCIAVLEGK